MSANQLSLDIAYIPIKTAGAPQQVQGSATLVKTVTIQNVSDPVVEVTIGTKSSLQAGEGIVLNAPPSAGKAGGSVELKAPEDVDDAFIDLSTLYWIGTTGAAISVMAAAWTPRYPTTEGGGNVQHNFYRV